MLVKEILKTSKEREKYSVVMDGKPIKTSEKKW